MPAAITLTNETLQSAARTLPAAPSVLAELGNLLQDVNTGLEEIADLLKQDASLAARIIRIANSSVYGAGARIGAIEEAVNRVGFGEVYRLVGLVTTSCVADRTLEYYGLEAVNLRENMLFTALAAEGLADSLGLDSRPAYTAGLLRPIGMLVLDHLARGRVPVEERFNPVTYRGYAEWEGQLFSMSSCEVGAMILSGWKFPQEIVAAVREHRLRRGTDADNRFAVLLNLAGWMALQRGHGLAGERCYFENAEERIAACGLPAGRIEALGDDVTATYERQRQNL